ncbi:TetR/AcrR family transcriptional regulator [Tetragenococcus halophilus]|uniref:TetR/AcrR family transcriptional regulator n=1 Tax=Tetragenococcus halophilus TaxID=51669 RepID=UPI002094FEB9|nr:TetR/AcrR family transcriptional regulator [Tetragenococcus halophilus]MCO7026505.1 TetR/AcrR family transcriptional regulator [Tetragenococcus halophilus]
MYEKILDIAEQLFMTQGYQATSTRQITELLGVTQPTIYYHFKKKEDIYYAVMLRLSKDIEQNLTKIVCDSTPDLETKLITMVEFLKKKHPFNFFVMMHDVQHSLPKEMTAKLYQLFSNSYKAPFVRLLKENSPKLRESVNIEFAVSQLFILMASYLDNTNPKDNISEMIDLYLHGIYRT